MKTVIADGNNFWVVRKGEWLCLGYAAWRVVIVELKAPSLQNFDDGNRGHDYIEDRVLKPLV